MESETTIKVLLIEDNKTNIKLIEKMLLKTNIVNTEVVSIEELAAGLEYLKNSRVDTLLLDLSLPDSKDYETFERVKEYAKEIPIIILTGLDDRTVAIKAVHEGAQDYLVKGHVDSNTLGRAISYSIERHKMTKEILKSKEALREHSEQLEKAVKNRTVKLTELNEQLRMEISERKQAERTLIKVNRALKTLSECNKAMVSTTNESELLNHICKIVVEVGGYSMAWIGFAGNEKDMAILPVAHAGYEEGYIRTLDLKCGSNIVEQNPVMSAINTGKTCIVKNMLIGREYDSCRDQALSRGFISSISIPLISNKRIFGALNIYSGEPDTFGEREKKMLIELGDDLVYGIMAFRTELERKRAEEMVEHLAYFDVLTGLPNWMMFSKHLSLAIEKALGSRYSLAVMFMGIDRIKTVNDTMGHAIGDELLRNIAERIKNCVRSCDIVARLKGNEFAILLPEIKGTSGIACLAERILDTIKTPFYFGDKKIHVNGGIGIVICPKDGHDTHTLLKNADTAMHNAERNGKDNYQFYKPSMNAEVIQFIDMENRMRDGLEKDEFIVYYQPKVNLKTGHIVGMEALVRWQQPDIGLVSPGKFIPVAEETELIIPIGEHVLRSACLQNKTWQDAGYPLVRVSVNLSAKQFQQSNLVEIIANALEYSKLHSKWLELEITETEVMKDTNFAISTLRELSDMGINISLDDFGTGYSSLNYLKHLPIDTIKIDYSFVRDITSDSDDAAIVRAIIAMSHSLKLKVIAEGVETLEQLNFLKDLDCEEIQGFFFSKPVPAKAFEKMLSERRCLDVITKAC